MNITLNIVAGTPGELQEAIAGLAGITTGKYPSTQPAKEEQKKVRETPKPEKQPDPKDSAPSEDNSETETPNESTAGNETVEIPTVVELRAKAQKKGSTPEGKKAIKALLNEFESKSISDVPEDKRAEFMTKLEEL